MKMTPAAPANRVKELAEATYGLLAETVRSWSNHHGQKMGAALAYYTAFSLAPLVILLFSVASLVLKTDARQSIIDQFNDLIGGKGGDAVKEIIDNAGTTQTAGWGTVISFVILIFSASGAFGELQDSLNQIWEVPPSKRPFFIMIKERALSFTMVFVLGFFMLVSLLLSVFIQWVSKQVIVYFPAAGLEVVNTLISFGIFTVLFAIIFRMLPEAPITWRDVWLGAVFSTVLFIVGKLLLGLYIGHSATFSTYGAAGSFVIILLWVFYSAQILYLGAEFTRAYTMKYGSHAHKMI